MNAHLPTKQLRRRATFAAIGLSLGGLAPLVTGLVGVWGYVTRGYFISKTGEIINGPLGMIASGLFVFAGMAMIGHAIWSYRRKTKRGL